MSIQLRSQVLYQAAQVIFSKCVLQADSLVDFKPSHKGHAIEVRINAEDPFRDFAPSAGTLGLVEWPECSSETGELFRVQGLGSRVFRFLGHQSDEQSCLAIIFRMVAARLHN
jgi:biotin carboxylase